METYQLIVCCLVSFLLIRRDFPFIMMLLYVLYYVCTDLLLKYDVVFYHQEYLLIVDVIILNLILNVLGSSKDENQCNDVKLLSTVGITILIAHLLLVIDKLSVFYLIPRHIYFSYYLTNWHLELLVLLLINVRVSQLSLSQKDFMNTLKTITGVNIILTITVLNYL